MPKKPAKAKKSKPKKTKKTARKPIKKAIRKPAKKKTVKKKPARKTTKPARKPAKTKAVMVVKPALPPMKLKTPAVPIFTGQRVGIVVHYYSHLSVAIIKLDQGALQVGDSIHIKGHTTDLKQRVESMQIEHQSIQRAEVGQEFGLQVSDHVREHDIVYKLPG
jgi:putative protease